MRASFTTDGVAAGFACIFGSTHMIGLPRFILDRLIRFGLNAESAIVTYNNDVTPSIAVNLNIRAIEGGHFDNLPNDVSRVALEKYLINSKHEHVHKGTVYGWFRTLLWRISDESIVKNLPGPANMCSVFAVADLVCEAHSEVKGNRVEMRLCIDNTTYTHQADLNGVRVLVSDEPRMSEAQQDDPRVYAFAVALTQLVRTDCRVYACEMSDWTYFVEHSDICRVKQRPLVSDLWVAPFWADGAWHLAQVNFNARRIIFTSKPGPERKGAYRPESSLEPTTQARMEHLIQSIATRRQAHSSKIIVSVKTHKRANIFELLYEVIIGPVDRYMFVCTCTCITICTALTLQACLTN
jgi:hypothetical protein